MTVGSRLLSLERELMMRTKPGSTFIEVIIATVLVGAGLVVIVLAIIDSNRSNNRTSLTSTALNVLQSQVDKDSRVAYNELDNNTPPVDEITSLPQAVLVREVRENTTLLGKIKHVRYILTWTAQGPQTLQTEYELTEDGLTND